MDTPTDSKQEPLGPEPLFQRGDGPIIAVLFALPLLLSVVVLGTPLHGPALEIFAPEGPGTRLASVSEVIGRYPHAPLTWALLALVWQIVPGVFMQHLLAPLCQGLGAVLLFLTATQIAGVVWPGHDAHETRRIPLNRLALAALAALYAVNDVTVTAAAYPLLIPVPLGGMLAIGALLCWTLALRRPQEGRWATLGILLYAGACGANLPVVMLPLAGLALGYRVRADWRVTLRTLAPPLLLAAIILAVVLGEGTGARQPLWDAVSPFLAVPMRGLIGGTPLPERFDLPPAIPGALHASQPLLLAALLALALIPEKGVLREGILHAGYTLVFGGMAIAFAYLTYTKMDDVQDPVLVWMAEVEHREEYATRSAAALHLSDYVIQQSAALEDVAARTQYVDAPRALVESLLSEPTDGADLFVSAARLAMVAGDAGDALEHAKLAVAADPYAPEAAEVRALAVTMASPKPGSLEEARVIVEACDRAREMEVLPVESRITYAMALGSLGEFSESLGVMSDLPSAMRGQAGSLLEELRTGARIVETSNQQFRQAASANPAAPARFVAEAQSALARKDYVSAYYKLERVMEKEPGNTRAFELMAMTLAGMGDAAAFTRMDDGTVERDGEAWSRAISASVATGNAEAAMVYVDHATQRLGPSWGGLQAARVLMGVGKFDEAETRLAEPLADVVHAGAAWVTMAELNLRKGDRDGATQALNQAASAGVPESVLAPLRQALQGR